MKRYVPLVCALAVALLVNAPAQAQPLTGDINGDGFVGALDLQVLLSNWGQAVTPGDVSKGDLFPDGFIGVSDLSPLLINWGQGQIPTPGGDASVGMNLSEVAYFSQEWVFVDAMKTHRKWVATQDNGSPFDTKQTVEVDADGWPTLNGIDAAQTLMFQGNGGAYPSGLYVCTYDGTGEVRIGFDGNAQTTTGRAEFNVTPSSAGLILRVVSSAPPPNHVRNIKVWMPDVEGQASSFHPTFIQRLQPFGVIRFMDWQQTNSSGVVSWSQRTTPATASQDNNFSGVALEYMIELCNELGADPWFSMPHRADDDYVQRFAEMVLADLAPGRKVYVEWSNEVWNSQFGQHAWVTQQSGASVFSNDWFQTWADEAATDFAIWRTVFVGSEDRIIRVAAGQAANVWVTQNLTDRLNDSQTGEPAYDAVSCAAYFDQRHNSFSTAGKTDVQLADEILDNAINDTIPNDYAGYYKDHGDLAQQRTNQLGRTIPLLAYEGGQHYTAGGQQNHPLFDAFLAMQTHTKMYEAYTDNLEAFDQGGGSLYVAFNFVGKQTKFGSWGHLQTQNESDSQSVAPKFRALLDFANK